MMELYIMCYCQSGFFQLVLLSERCNAATPMLFGVSIIGSFSMPYCPAYTYTIYLCILLFMDIWVYSFHYLVLL